MKDGRDIVAQAQSGKGKTGAFTVASLAIIDCEKRFPQVVILSPTRELSDQTYVVTRKLGANLKGLSVAECVGGSPVRECIRILRTGPQIVIGTPGRMRHMLESGELNLSHLRCVVLDEADEMLDRGFRDSMYDIFEHCPQDVQVCLFSATYTPDVLEVTERMCRNPYRILVKKEEVTLDGIKQFYVDCDLDRYKLEILCDLYECLSISQLIIFVNSKRRVEDVFNFLNAQDHTCSCIHGGISTDLLARGIDVQNVGTVINFDLPHNDFSNYIHRIGRSGRHGKKGLALNFITNHHRDTTTIRELERYYSTKINELPADLATIE